VCERITKDCADFAFEICNCKVSLACPSTSNSYSYVRITVRNELLLDLVYGHFILGGLSTAEVSGIIVALLVVIIASSVCILLIERQGELHSLLTCKDVNNRLRKY